MSGIKYDTGKNDMGLLFREVPYALEELSKALQMGSEKYGVGNWLKVEDGNNRYLSALVRHLTAYHQGELLDKESGLSHLAHVAVNALFILDLETRNDHNLLSQRGVSFGQPNDRRSSAEIGQIQKDIHSGKRDNLGAKGVSVCTCGKCIISVSAEGGTRGGTGCSVHFGQQG